MGRLTTHVLDTSTGRPAGGIKGQLFAVRRDQRTPLKTFTTNADGRTDVPLLSGDDLGAGVYELVFQAGDHFKLSGVVVSDPSFLDEVVIRFGIADTSANHHVPLLISPFGYTTYRGS